MKIFQQEISESHRNLVKGQQMAKILPSYAWFVLGENGADESLIFYQNGTFVITQNNEEKKGLWQYNSTLQTLYMRRDDNISALHPFFRNNEVLVLKLHQEDAYLFLIKSECVNKFDYHVLEDFNTYAERWESAQIAKGKKEKFWEELKEQRTPIDRKPVKAKKEKEFFLEERPARTPEEWLKREEMLKQNFEYKKQQYKKKFEAQMARKLREREREIEIDFMHRMATQEAKFQELLVRQRCEAQTELSRLKKKENSRKSQEGLESSTKEGIINEIMEKWFYYQKNKSVRISQEMEKILAKDKGYKKVHRAVRYAFGFFIASPFFILLLTVFLCIGVPEGYITDIVITGGMGAVLVGGMSYFAYQEFCLSEEEYKRRFKEELQRECDESFLKSLR